MEDFFPTKYITYKSIIRFGLCDCPNVMAYLSEDDKVDNWIAVVDNGNSIQVGFVPVDHCIDLRKPNGDMDKRCDGLLFYNTTIIFVELKEQNPRLGKNTWLKDGDNQLRSTISHFEKEGQSVQFTVKKAYIANRLRPSSRASYQTRTDRFFNDTGYILEIKNTIEID